MTSLRGTALRPFRAFLGVGGATLLQGLCGVCGLSIAARSMPAIDLGGFVLMQVVVSVFVMLSDFALQGMALSRSLAVAVTHDERRRLAGTGLVWKTTVGLAAATLLVAISPAAPSLLGAPALKQLTNYAAALILLTCVEDVLTAILQGVERYAQIAIITAGTAIVRLGVTAALLLWLDRGVSGLAEAFVVAATVSVALRLMATTGTVGWSIDRSTLAVLWRFGLPLAANGALTVVFTRLDRVILSRLSGPAGVALYDVASRIPDALQRLYDALRVVLLPSVASLIGRREPVAASQLIDVAIRGVVLCTGVTTVGVIAFQTEIVKLLFSAEYSAAGPVLGLLMLSLNVALVGNLLGTSLVAAGRADAPLKVGGVMVALSLGGNLLLVPRWGPMGAALAALVANTATNFTISLWLIRRTDLDVRVGWALVNVVALSSFWLATVVWRPDGAGLRVLTGLACLVLPALGLIVSARSRDWRGRAHSPADVGVCGSHR